MISIDYYPDNDKFTTVNLLWVTFIPIHDKIFDRPIPTHYPWSFRGAGRSIF